MPESLSAFTSRRQPRWDELDHLVDAAGGRVGSLDPGSVRRLGRCYRQAAADLAQARRRYPGDPVTVGLDRLVGRARPVLYGSVIERASIRSFATTGYWRRVRERPIFLMIAALTLFGPSLVIGVWANGHPVQAARVAQVSPLSGGSGRVGRPRVIPTPRRSPTRRRTRRSRLRSSPTTPGWR